MERTLRKVFGIYAGEGRTTFHFARFSLLWALGVSTLETLSDGLFLDHVGASELPYVYLLTALMMIGLSSLVLYSLKLTSPYRILNLAMGAGILVSSAAALLIALEPSLEFFFILKISSRMLFALLMACSWTFIDQYHDLRDAKRVYSIYGSAYFAGSISSGTLISLGLDTIGFSGLFLLAGCSILGSMAEARMITRKIPPIVDDTVEGAHTGDRHSFSGAIRLIIRSPFTILLLSLSLVIQLLLVVTEFSYMETFGNVFQGSDGAITEFLGTCRAWISTTNIFIGIFLYGRFVRRLGLANAILITPFAFFATYAGWIGWDTLLIAVAGLVVVDGILFTIEDNCFNLLSSAVPSKLKSKVRIINDSFFEPVGMLFSALLLIGLEASNRWLGLVLSVLALLVTFLLRHLYPKALLINLKEHALHFERRLPDWLSTMSRRERIMAQKHLTEKLSFSDEESRLLAAEGLLSLSEPSVLPQVLQAGRSFGTHAKISLLRLLNASPFRQEARVVEAVSLWAGESSSPEFAKWAQVYLARRGLYPLQHAEDELDHPEIMIRCAAILSLLLSKAPLDKAIAEKRIDLMLKSSRIDEVSLGLELLAEVKKPENAEKALPFLSHETVLLKRSAARCIAELADKRLSRIAPCLIEAIADARDSSFRLECIGALGKIGDTTSIWELLAISPHFRPIERRRAEDAVIRMGLKTVPLLLSAAKDLSLPERGRILASKILSRLALPQLQANLMEIVGIEIDRAYFYFYFGHTIQKHYPLYDLSLLQSSLLTGNLLVIDFIIHLLGAAGSLKDPEHLVRGLHSKNGKLRSHAVESLGKTCDPRIFRLIAPLIDDLPLEEKLSACLRHQGEFPHLSLSDLLSRLEESPLLFDKIVACRLKSKLQMPGWRQTLREQLKTGDETFHQYVYELLETTQHEAPISH
jgi:HEAT repeat protein